MIIVFVLHSDVVSPSLESITWELQYNRYFWLLFYISFCIGHSHHSHHTSWSHCHKNDFIIISYIFLTLSNYPIILTLLLTSGTLTLLQPWTNHTYKPLNHPRIIFVSDHTWRTHDSTHHPQCTWGLPCEGPVPVHMASHPCVLLLHMSSIQVPATHMSTVLQHYQYLTSMWTWHDQPLHHLL